MGERAALEERAGTPPAGERAGDGYLLEPPGPLDWAELFGNVQPVELEVGCGKGLFLLRAATRDPRTNFFGVEISRKYARFTADRLARHAVANARVARADVRVLMRDAVRDRSVSVLHVYFPDPWWKRRHKKRRVFGDEFVCQAARVLVPSGELRFASDVEEYFGVMYELVAKHPAFVPLGPPTEHTPQHDLDYLSNFERKYRKAGRPIFRAQFLKNTD